MDPTKITSIVEFPQPNLVKKLQSFLGLINFSLRFIPHLSMITAPMRQLLIKETPFQWNEAFQKSFTDLKKLIQSVVVLARPDFTKSFRLQRGASNSGLGAILLQQDELQQWRPISYLSRALTKTKQNYSTIEKEFLAIV
jgi:hypothetical protein